MVPVEKLLVLHLDLNHYYYALPNLMLVKNLVVNQKMAIQFAGVILLCAIRLEVSNVSQMGICLISIQAAKIVNTKIDLPRKLWTVVMVLVQNLLVPNWDQNHYIYVLPVLKMMKHLVVET